MDVPLNIYKLPVDVLAKKHARLVPQGFQTSTDRDSAEAASSTLHRVMCPSNSAETQSTLSAVPNDAPSNKREPPGSPPRPRKDRYLDSSASEPATPDSDVPPLSEVEPAFDVGRSDEMIPDNNLLPSRKPSKAAQNAAKDQFSFWMKSLNSSEIRRNNLAQEISTARHQPPPGWRQSATPTSVSSTVSFSPAPEPKTSRTEYNETHTLL